MAQDKAQDPAGAVSVPTDEAQVTERRSARVMFAMVALATELPLPECVTCYVSDDGVPWLKVRLASLADGHVWAERFGIEVKPRVHGGSRHLSARTQADWCGWKLDLSAWEEAPAAGEELADGERVGLAALVDGEAAS